MEHRFYKLEIFVPEDYFAAVRQALWSVDAGHIGEYDRCLSWSRVNSCWRPLEGADPFEGADKVIFPGVGEAETTMNHLMATGLDELIKNLRQPVFGICLGMQLMCRHSEEGEVDCLNIFDVDVKRFVPQKHEDKVPHMGWNTIGKTNSKLFEGFTEEEFAR